METREAIIKELKKYNSEDVVFVCIGSNDSDVVFDNFGPLVGTMLNTETDLKVLGTMSKPIDNETMNSILEEKRELLENNKVVSIDACNGDVCNKLELEFDPNNGVLARAGIDDSHNEPIGSASIMCTTTITSNVYNFKFNKDDDRFKEFIINDTNYYACIDFDTIYMLARYLVDIIKEAYSIE